MSQTNVPAKRDILAEHLYTKVREFQHHELTASKITGMLLESRDDNLLKMLENTSYLHTCVIKGLQVLETQHHEHDTNSDRNVKSKHANTCQDMCDLLYEKIALLEPDMCSKITGMLVELDPQTVSQLLTSEVLLREAVMKAKDSCTLFSEPLHGDHILECNNNNLNSELCPLGDILYEKVYAVFPDFASQITGMLLEMDEAELKKLLLQPSLLQTCMGRAYQVLQCK